MGFPGGTSSEEPACQSGDLGDVRDMGSFPGLGRLERSPGEENGNPFQCFCLGNPMHRGAWRAILHGVAKELAMTL